MAIIYVQSVTSSSPVKYCDSSALLSGMAAFAGLLFVGVFFSGDFFKIEVGFFSASYRECLVIYIMACLSVIDIDTTCITFSELSK